MKKTLVLVILFVMAHFGISLFFIGNEQLWKTSHVDGKCWRCIGDGQFNFPK